MLRTTIPRLFMRSSPSPFSSSSSSSSACRTSLRVRSSCPPSRPFTQRSTGPSSNRIPPKRSSPTASSSFFTTRAHAQAQTQAQSILRRLFHSSRARFAESTAGAAATENLSLGQRMKKLGREYGWSGVGVYAALCVLDFPFCYLFVKTIGTDRIGEWEHQVIESVKTVIPESVSTTWNDWRKSLKKAEHDITGSEDFSDGVEMAGWGVEEAEKHNKAEASLATQLALAYAIHKSFIFIRVPITVAITPKVVKMLRGWGWDIGKRTTKEAKAIKRAALPPKKN